MCHNMNCNYQDKNGVCKKSTPPEDGECMELFIENNLTLLDPDDDLLDTDFYNIDFAGHWDDPAKLKNK